MKEGGGGGVEREITSKGDRNSAKGCINRGKKGFQLSEPAKPSATIIFLKGQEK